MESKKPEINDWTQKLLHSGKVMEGKRMQGSSQVIRKIFQRKNSGKQNNLDAFHLLYFFNKYGMKENLIVPKNVNLLGWVRWLSPDPSWLSTQSRPFRLYRTVLAQAPDIPLWKLFFRDIFLIFLFPFPVSNEFQLSCLRNLSFSKQTMVGLGFPLLSSVTSSTSKVPLWLITVRG